MIKKFNLLQILMVSFVILLIFGIQQRLFFILSDPPLPHLGLFMFLPFLLLFASFLLFKRLRWFFNSLWVSVLIITLVSDIAYFKFFQTLPSLMSQLPFQQAWDVKDSIITLLTVTDLISIGSLLIIWIYSIYFFIKSKPIFQNLPSGKNIPVRIILSSLGIILTVFFYYRGLQNPIIERTHHIGRSHITTPQNHWGAKYSHIDYAKVFGPINFHVNDIYKAYISKTEEAESIDPQIKEKMKKILKKRWEDNNSISPLYSIAGGYNVIFILLESFQHFLLNLKIDDTEVIPFINHLYKESLHWDHIYDATQRGRTADAEFAIHTGLYPDLEKVSAFNHVNKHFFVFPNELKKRHYKTFSFHGYKKDFWNRTNSHPFFGIDNLKFRESFPIEDKLGLGVPDKIVFPMAVRMLSESQSPFYGLIISLSCHHPYKDLPKESQNLFPSLPNNDPFEVGYLKLAHYTDEAVKILYEELEACGLLDNTIIAIFGDHELGMLDPNADSYQLAKIVENMNKLIGNNAYAIDEDRVVFLINIPSKTKEIIQFMENKPDINGTLADLFPTIFHLMGIPIPNGIMGTQLFHSNERLFYLPPAYDYINKRVLDRFATANQLYTVSKNQGNTIFKCWLTNQNAIEDQKQLERLFLESNFIKLTNHTILKNDAQLEMQ
jgi:lipoteichoic acid synthase